MSTTPTIPPRPTRGQNSSATAHMEVPKIPPRPNRSMDRSVSPQRDTFARSPLNDPTFLHNAPPREGSRLSTELPPRPPSVSMPALGEEGSEYASLEHLAHTPTNESQPQLYPHGSPQQTKNIAGDLPLHAPTASVPSSTAKRNIAAVTRTDSSTAVAAGLGKPASDDKSARSGSSLGSRPASLYNDKETHGIPEIGVQVPMFRNAGDVQAPTPSPFEQQAAATGVGFHNKPAARHHGRTKSGREIFHGPPGSYGMHGHGVISDHEFEQKWYEKHPEDMKREKAGEYGPHIQENRKDYHWRSDNLEKLVHARTQDAGMGTSRDAVSTPDEQIGYMATEAYAMRMASPKPASSGRPASIKGAHADSPLRQGEQSVDNSAAGQRDDNGDVYHIDPPAHSSSKIHGGGYDPPTADLGPEGGNTDHAGGWVTERGYGTPILASDELKKRGSTEWRQAAVSPELERRGDEYTVNEHGTPAYITKPRTHSRSSSQTRTQRVIPSPAQFDRGGTPLESHKEYEPLFPEDEDDGKKPKIQADKLKRPNARHQFPSQDVWEDAPGSLQLETTVETPQPDEEPDTSQARVSAAKAFEKPESEELRKDDITEEDQQSFLPEHTNRFAVANKHLANVRNVRPGTQQRFPSQDIWEDAPDHGHLETTVSTPQTDDTNEYAPESPIVDKPTIPPRPNVSARPQRAEQSPVDKKLPIIPDRPKPQIPMRPVKSSTSSPEKGLSFDSQAENDAPQPKAKPSIPVRPGGSKIAALQAGFLKDLNNKLGLGPPAPKVKQPEREEEAPAPPLTDARKSRAKGPQRRRPATSSVPAATVTAEVAVPRQKLDIAPVTAIWSFGEDGLLDVPAATMAAKIQQALKKPEPVGESSQKSETVKEPLTKSESVEEPLTKSESVEKPLAKSETAEEPLTKPETVKEPLTKPEPVKEPLTKPETVKEPLAKSESVKEPLTKPESVEEPLAKSETAKEPLAKSETAEKPLAKSETVKEPLAKSDSAKEPTKKSESSKEPAKKSESAKEPLAKSESAKEPLAKSESVKEPLAKSDSVKEPTKKSESSKEPTKKSESSKESTKKSESSKEPAKKSESAKEPLTKSESVKEPLAKSESVKEPLTKPESAEEPTKKSESVEKPLAKSETVKEPLAKSESVKEPLTKPESAKEPLTKSESAEEPTKKSESVEEPLKKSEPLAEPLTKSESVQESSKKPDQVQEPTILGSAAAKFANLFSGGVELAKSVTMGSEAASAVPQDVTTAVNTVPQSVDAAPSTAPKDDKPTSTPKSEEPLVTQPAQGSADAPGAFPETATKGNAGTLPEPKSHAEQSVKLGDEEVLEGKREPATAAVKEDTA